MIEGSNNLRFSLFPDPVGHFGLYGQLGIEGVAGGERVPPAPLGWYFTEFSGCSKCKNIWYEISSVVSPILLYLRADMQKDHFVREPGFRFENVRTIHLDKVAK